MIEIFKSRPYDVKLLNPLLSAGFLKDIKKNILKPKQDFIYNLTGYELIDTNKDCGGFFDGFNKKIAVNPDEKNIIPILFHELGHFLQQEQGIDLYKDYTLSHQVILEQQCDAFSLMLYREILSSELPMNHWSYFDNEGYIFLRDWYNGFYENDIEKLLVT